MVGGGNRRDDGPIGINSTNVFAALDSLRRKKKSDGSSKSKGSSKKETEPAPVFWAPAPLTVKSWADVDDDDDYYATTAPPQSVWGSSAETQQQQQSKESEVLVEVIDCTGCSHCSGNLMNVLLYCSYTHVGPAIDGPSGNGPQG